MDENEKNRLYQEMINESVVPLQEGLLEVSLESLKKYHALLDLEEGCPLLVGLNSDGELTEEYETLLWPNCDKKAKVELFQARFYDLERDKTSIITGDNALYNAMYFCFARALKPENDICFSNNVMIDEEGRLYLDMMYSPDIYATFRLTFKPGSFGYSFFDGRSGTTRRFWRDGDKFYIAKTAVFTIRS